MSLAEVCCRHWNYSNAGCIRPGTYTHQIQAAFREPRFLVMTDPGTDYQPLTEESCINLPTIALCNRLSTLLCGHCQPMQQQGSSLSGSDVEDTEPGRSLREWHYLQRAPIGSYAWSLLPVETGKEEEAAAERLSPRRSFRVNRPC